MNALTELEELKPAVKQKIIELKQAYQVNGPGQFHQKNSLHWSTVKKETLTNYDASKVQFLYIMLVEISIFFQFAELCFINLILGGNLDFKWQFIIYSVAHAVTFFAFFLFYASTLIYFIPLR
jgi:hypothetical protein